MKIVEDNQLITSTLVNDQDVKTVIVKSIGELEQYKNQYDLTPMQKQVDFFPCYQYDWIMCLWRYYLSSPANLRFIFIFNCEKLVAIAPLQLHVKGFGLFSTRTLCFFAQLNENALLENTSGVFFIHPSVNNREIIDIFMDTIFHELAPDWDHLCLNMVSENLDYTDILKNRLMHSNQEVDTYITKHLSSWENTLAKFSKKEFKTLSRRMKKLEQSGMEFQYTIHQAINETLFDEICDLHTRRQNEIEEISNTVRNKFLDRQNDLSKQIYKLFNHLSYSGQLRIYCLHIDNKLCAFDIVINNDTDSSVSWCNSFSSDFSSYSPANLLSMFMYQSEFENFSIKRINLLSGHTRAKAAFSTHSYENNSFYAVNQHWHSRIRRTVWKLSKSIVNVLRKVRK